MTVTLIACGWKGKKGRVKESRVEFRDGNGAGQG